MPDWVVADVNLGGPEIQTETMGIYKYYFHEDSILRAKYMQKEFSRYRS